MILYYILNGESTDLPEVVQTMMALARHLRDASTAATAVVCVTSAGEGII